jgi:peroxiredoxin
MKRSSLVNLFVCAVLAAALLPWPAQAQGAAPAPAAPQGLAVGDVAPAIEGTAHDGRRVVLAELLRQGPVVVTFYRGVWCPFCNRYLKQLQDSVAALGGRVVAITPETPELARQMAEKTGATYPIVSDAAGALLEAYRVGFALDEATLARYKDYGIDLRANHGGRAHLPVPATYVVGTDGRIRFVHFDANYKNRARLADLKTTTP